MPIATTDPATGQLVRSFDELTETEIETRLTKAATAFRAWRRLPVAERAAVVRRAGGILGADQQAFGDLMTLEMGKPVAAAVEEAAKCATACRFYADHAEAFLAPEPVTGEGLSGGD